MELLDSRRLTGPNILWERPGAVADVALDEALRAELIAAWGEEVRRLLDALGWSAQESCVRAYAGGASLAISAPLDALYAATEVNESAWRAARARLGSGEPVDFEAELRRLRAEIAAEANPPLLALCRAARERGLAFLCDDELVTVGLGTGSRTFAARELPRPAELDWPALHEVPTAMITGTNGKTTTVRLVAAMAEAAGRVPGVSSTDRVSVGSAVLAEGDWSGPGGARLVLRDRRTQVGLLETARGGMLRRGLALEHCDVGAVLNVGADHLGEWGVGDIEGLADGKLVLARAARVMVLNADDPVLAARGAQLLQEVVWFGLDPALPSLAAHLVRGGRACVLRGDELWLHGRGQPRLVLRVGQIPIALGGAARFNVANALAAAAVAEILGFSLEEIRSGLRNFQSTPAQNPGRQNRFELGAVHAMVDFAHNPHGVRAALEMAWSLPGERRLIVLGQAGDREELSIREMARLAWDARPDMIVIKELTEHLRGRAPGVIPALIEDELRALGAPEERFVHCESELEAVSWALDWARPGDLLLLFVHDKREEVLALLEERARSGWTPGN